MKKATNKQLQTITKLKQNKYRNKSGLYIASGFNTVKTCLTAKIPIYQLLVRQDNVNLLPNLKIPYNTDILLLTDEEFKHIADEKSPQGIALVLPQVINNIDDDIPKEKTIVYLDRINDPGNLGTIIRSALWFGINTIFLSPDSIDPYHPKVVRAGVGYTTLSKIYQQISYAQLDNFKSQNGYSLCTTLLKEGNPLNNHRPKEKTILAFGSEAHGISSALYNLSDFELTIPRSGKGESLNLSAAASIFFYHWSNF